MMLAGKLFPEIGGSVTVKAAPGADCWDQWIVQFLACLFRYLGLRAIHLSYVILQYGGVILTKLLD